MLTPSKCSLVSFIRIWLCNPVLVIRNAPGTLVHSFFAHLWQNRSTSRLAYFGPFSVRPVVETTYELFPIRKGCMKCSPDRKTLIIKCELFYEYGATVQRFVEFTWCPTIPMYHLIGHSSAFFRNDMTVSLVFRKKVMSNFWLSDVEMTGGKRT